MQRPYVHKRCSIVPTCSARLNVRALSGHSYSECPDCLTSSVPRYFAALLTQYLDDSVLWCLTVTLSSYLVVSVSHCFVVSVSHCFVVLALYNTKFITLGGFLYMSCRSLIFRVNRVFLTYKQKLPPHHPVVHFYIE